MKSVRLAEAIWYDPEFGSPAFTKLDEPAMLFRTIITESLPDVPVHVIVIPDDLVMVSFAAGLLIENVDGLVTDPENAGTALEPDIFHVCGVPSKLT